MTDHLRPKVREAVETVDAWAAALPKEYTKGSPWEIIRAELERQAAEIAELRALLDDPGTTHSEGCWTWGRRHYVCARNRIDALTQERNALHGKLAEVDADRADAWANESAWRLRAEAAESELAAMRAKWDAARVIEPWKYWDDRDLPQAFGGTQGRRVRLVVEDDTP